jgi:hypothetical protein
MIRNYWDDQEARGTHEMMRRWKWSQFHDTNTCCLGTGCMGMGSEFLDVTVLNLAPLYSPAV